MLAVIFYLSTIHPPLELINYLYKWMTYILYIPVPFSFKVFLFERKNNHHMVDGLLHFLHAVLFPCPHLWRDIEYYPDTLLFGPFGYAKIEAGIIYQHQHIWLELLYVFFTKGQILKNCSYIHQHFHKPHKSKFFIMLYECCTSSLHQVSTPAADIGICIQLV